MAIAGAKASTSVLNAPRFASAGPEGLAQVYTWAGDRDRAIELVQKLLTTPGYTNYARLKLHPLWASLRADAHFDKIVASLTPK